MSAKSVIYVIVDHDDFYEESAGETFTPEALKEMCGYVTEFITLAAPPGYEGSNTIFDADDGLLRLMADRAQKES